MQTEAACPAPGCSGTVMDLAPQALAVEPIAPAHVMPEARPLPWGWLIAVAVGVAAIAAMVIAVQLGSPLKTVLVVAIVVAALGFDYVNGMHDAGNAIATVISTRVLAPWQALLMAAVLNLFGALLFTKVASSIATKFSTAPITDISPLMILCGILGASAWSYFTARIGLPVSTSHSLFGGLIGVFLVGRIPLNMQYMGKLGLWMVLAPLLAFTAGWILMLGLTWVFHRAVPSKVNKHFRHLQLVSSALMAFAHGSNDAQKAMGIITMALVTGGFIVTPDFKHVDIPLWVKVACALVIALGTGFGGMRVIRTLGHKIIKLAPVHGFAAETVASGTIMLVTFLGIPISTTHAISSSILGIGASKRLSTVRWGVATSIVLAWVITIPTCAIAGAALYALVRWIIGVV
jgi:PiT family inorganic phosphate transporter